VCNHFFWSLRSKPLHVFATETLLCACSIALGMRVGLAR
jgi:hypothetical protein